MVKLLQVGNTHYGCNGGIFSILPIILQIYNSSLIDDVDVD
jgi:hypothetical protein